MRDPKNEIKVRRSFSQSPRSLKNENETSASSLVHRQRWKLATTIHFKIYNTTDKTNFKKILPLSSSAANLTTYFPRENVILTF